MSDSQSSGIQPPFSVVRPRILVVDDEAPLCVIVRKMLSYDPYDVETTTSALDALQRLQHESFDLLLSDISMPEMNGLELAEQARAANASLGIVIMTAYGSYDHLERALRTGSANFIHKPFKIDELRLAIKRALEQQQVSRDNVRLQTLVKVFEYSRMINGTLDPATLYTVVVDLVTHETDATAVGLWIVDDVGQLRLEHGTEISVLVSDAAQTLTQHVHEMGALQTAPCLAEDESGGEGLLFALPLIVGDERLGVLVVGYRRTQSAALAELLGIIANQTALAVRNARQYYALQELDRLKSEFIGIASHELRTPLSLVLGYSSLLRSRLEGRDRKDLQHVIDGALRIGDIVDDLVHMRRSEQHKASLDLSQFNIWELLEEVVAELSPLAASRGVTIRLTCPDTPQRVTADRDKISLVLAHLVDNATKFMASGEVVRIEGAAPADDDPEMVRIDVCDTGIGIAPRDVSRIFERFYQAAPSTTRMHGGLGIGLSMTKMLVELHGGQVRVQSDPGQGSVFQVRLPIAPDPEVALEIG